MFPPPHTFSWVEKGKLGAMGLPNSREDLSWLRDNGVQLLISLTEDPVRRDWVDDAGLLALHIPVPDMTAPTAAQLERAVSAIDRAAENGMGVAVHCAAGRGRTGTILAAYFVARGLAPREAMAKVRDLRPGSIETHRQEAAVEEFARRFNGG